LPYSAQKTEYVEELFPKIKIYKSTMPRRWIGIYLIVPIPVNWIP